MTARLDLYGVAVDAVTTDEAVAWIDRTITGGCRGGVVTLNSTGLMLAAQQPFFGRYVRGADLVVADGQPLVWLSRLVGTRLPGRVAGIDMVERLAGHAAAQGHAVYLLGAEADTVAAAAAELAGRHPGLRVVGHHHGFLGDREAAVAAAIGRSGAAILLVGMGSPRQERFIDDHWDQLGVNVAMGVGGSFEVLAHRLSRAPVWIQRLGFEWAYRMIQEPRRLAGRYMQTFLWLVGRFGPAIVDARRNRSLPPLPSPAGSPGPQPSPFLRRRGVRPRSGSVVVADGLQQEPLGIPPEAGVVGGRVLGELAGLVHDIVTAGRRPPVNGVDGTAPGDHEGQVLEPGSRCVEAAGRIGGGIDEEVGAGPASDRPVGELIVVGQKRLEPDQGHQLVVVRPGRRQVADADPEMSDHERQCGR